jgi:hypothetical protein
MVNVNGTVCFYPILSGLPNSFHYNTARILSNRPDFIQVVCIIPNKNAYDISPEKCKEIFETYLKLNPTPNIIPVLSPKGDPFDYIIDNKGKDDISSHFVAVSEKVGRSDYFNRKLEPFPNIQVELIPGDYSKSSNKMYNAMKNNDYMEFSRYLPEQMKREQKKEIWDKLHSDPVQQVQDKNFWTKVIKENLI